MSLYYQWITARLAEVANPANASAMKAYMKNHFEFYGVNAPTRKKISRLFIRHFDLKSLDSSFWELVALLWENNHRECQYIAIDLMQFFARALPESCLPFLESLIITKSWWDTVDGIAPSLVGELFKKYPEKKNYYIHKWVEDDNLWLQRAAIIFQLKYAHNTDWNLLSEVILKHEDSKEFFVRKAQGWALRQYSRYEPLKVMAFVEANPQLSGLTKKEALRNLTF
jgi:3-methyladenine DNA glycosylase AlkD